MSFLPKFIRAADAANPGHEVKATSDAGYGIAVLAAMALLGSGCILSSCGSASGGTTSTRLAGGDIVRSGVATQRAAPGTGGGSANDDNPTKTDVGSADDNPAKADVGSGEDEGGEVKPCKLVTHAQAQAIVGHSIGAPQEAPLGPTCIFQGNGSTGAVTLTVESIHFAAIRDHIRDRKRLMVAGHRAYCGYYGQQMTYVLLPGGRVLNVTGPCSLGVRFAAAALPHLKS